MVLKNKTNLTLYCNSYKGKEPLHQQYNQKTLMCGSYFLDKNIKEECIQKKYLLDDTKINISTLNPVFGDLTGLFWIWKNSEEEFVGTNQYRRFYNETEVNKFFKYQTQTLFVSNFLTCYTNVWDHYINCHGEIGIKILQEASRLKKIPLTKEMIDTLYNSNIISSCNMFFAHKDLFNKVCEIYFEILLELYQGTKYLLNFIQDNLHAGRPSNDKRLLAFLGERILNIIYLHSDYFFGKIEIQPINFSLKKIIYDYERQYSV